MGLLRTPFLFVAIALFVVVLLIDAGGSSILISIVAGDVKAPPGRGVPAIAFLDALILLQVGLLGADALRLGRVARWVNGPGVLLLSIVTIIGGIASALVALGKVILMVAILMALPFGPLIYAAIWGSFERGVSLGVLSTTFTLRIVAGICLVLYDQSMLGKKQLIVLFFTWLVAGVIVSFLLSLVPTLLCSITDAIAAIIVAILAIIWAIILLIPGITGTLRLIRLKA